MLGGTAACASRKCEPQCPGHDPCGPDRRLEPWERLEAISGRASSSVRRSRAADVPRAASSVACSLPPAQGGHSDRQARRQRRLPSSTGSRSAPIYPPAVKFLVVYVAHCDSSLLSSDRPLSWLAIHEENDSDAAAREMTFCQLLLRGMHQALISGDTRELRRWKLLQASSLPSPSSSSPKN